MISGVAGCEIEEWLREPWRNKERANAIRAAMDGATWISKFRMGRSTPRDLAIVTYAHLLGVRRLLALPIWGGTTLVGTHAADKSKTMDAIKKKIGKRAMGLARKWRQDAEKSGASYASDEMHCLMVIVYALINQRDSVLLTADWDYIEIFYKAQWFFNTHYRAWLAAKMIKDGWYGKPAMEFAETAGYFDGPLTLYSRPTTNLQEVLPAISEPVSVGVFFVDPDHTIHMMVCPFEPQMLNMLETKGTTDGRCTDLFGDANIHVDLGPLKRKMHGLYLGIGKDAVDTFETDGIRSRLSRLDLEHSVTCNERCSH